MLEATIIAAVDIGSNTLHQVVMRTGAAVTDLELLDRRVELLRLGADVAETGAIGEKRAKLAEDALREMATRATERGATVRLGLATEGVRAASNATEMIARFTAAYGIPITMITGLEEAALSFWGALSELPPSTEPVAVGDLGGGSCELVVGIAQQIAFARSIPLGSGQLIEAVQPADPPAAEDFARLRTLATERMASVPRPDNVPQHLLAVGGTAASLTRLTHGDDQPRVLTPADLQRARDQLMFQPLEATANQSRLDINRVRLLVGGAVAWEVIMDWLGVASMQISHRGVREGAIIAWRQAGDNWQAFAAAANPH